MKKRQLEKNNKKQVKKRKLNELAQKAIEHERQQLIDYLFATICNKKQQKINFDTLLKALVAYDLIKDIDEDDVEKMLETFSDQQTLDRKQFENLFNKCNINLKPYLIDNQI